MIGSRSFSPVALPGGYGSWGKEEDGWLDCQGASRYLLGVARCWAWEALTSDNGSGTVQPEAPIHTETGPVTNGQQTPGPPDIWDKEKNRPPGASIAAIAVGVILLGTGVYLFSSKGRR